jgi:Bromodomain
MDLGTVKRKLERREYRTEDEIRRDLELVWNNCKRYNKPGSTIYKAAEKMERSCAHVLSKFPSNSTMLRKRNPLDEIYNTDDGTLSVKVLLFKKLKELDGTKLRELIQELIRKHPSCVKEVG